MVLIFDRFMMTHECFHSSGQICLSPKNFERTNKMSAIEKVNSSGLSADEKKALKALMGHKPSIRDQIAEDSAVDDDLLRAYLDGPGKTKHHLFTFIFLRLDFVFSCLFSSCIITCCSTCVLSSFVFLQVVLVDYLVSAPET